MKHILIIFIAISIGSAENFDKATIFFVGPKSTDFKTVSIYSDLDFVYNTSYFNPAKPSALVIHGYHLGCYNDSASTVLIEAYIKNSDYNLLFLDWSSYNKLLKDLKIVQNLPVIASIAAQILKKLKAKGYDLSRFHVVAHSTGCPIAAYLCRQLQLEGTTFDMAVGLDPAGPFFYPSVIWPIAGFNVTLMNGNMLRQGDAKFVQIIHTNVDGVGTSFTTGDVDFWPQGGYTQNHCTNINDIFDRNVCNHYAASEYYAESVTNKIPKFLAIRCRNKFLIQTRANCLGPETENMGLYAGRKSKAGNYFLKTRPTAPYSY